MSSSLKNITLIVLTLALAALGTLIWQQNRLIAALELKAREENTAAREHLAAVEQRLATAEKRQAELETAAEPRPRGTMERTRPNAAGFVPRATALPLENPALQRVIATGMRGSLDQRYGMLFRQLKLAPVELERFKDLLTERQMSSLDAMTAARVRGVNPTELPALVDKVQGEVDQNIRALLGDARFAQYEGFNQHMTSYSALDQIERRLSYTHAPLEIAQSEALLRILIETAPPAAEEGTPLRNMMGMAQTFTASSPVAAALGSPAITEETISRASAVLSPTQTEVLRQLQAEQQSQMTMMRSVRIETSGPSGSMAGSAEAFHVTPVPASLTVPQEEYGPSR